MQPSESARVNCPYCGESLEIVLDPSVRQQQYVEDCQVCCQPIQFRVRVGADGDVSLDARREDD